jgi:aminoglycoside/choline kinase family phosphotransferase
MTKEEEIKQLYRDWTGAIPDEILSLGAHGSARQYWRIIKEGKSCIAAWNNDIRENEAFFYYSRNLATRGINVPEVFAISSNRKYYLQQDLGDTTLFSLLYDKQRKGCGFDAKIMALYKQVLFDLVAIQTSGRDMDFSYAYPRSDFDAQSIQWDLNYFKYCFLKLRHTPFDEELLENDFQTLIHYLLNTDCGFFLYRDFQTRNIMLVNDKPYYIDFQGGRRGAAQYDVASLLYSSKSNISDPIRQELLSYYIHCLAQHANISIDDFRQRFYGYALIRIMQAMGAYGYRGYFERKDYFLGSIPLAVNNLRSIIESHPLPIKLPHLTQVFHNIIEQENTQSTAILHSGLRVTVNSFSYKKGIPQDPSGNGGGFVFDCRALPNPGRYPQYKTYTGKDRPVIEFLQGDIAVEQFLAAAQQLVGASITKYLERNFTNLTVSFGCTGGQHRSVYCAERLSKWITENFNCQVVTNHIEQH